MVPFDEDEELPAANDDFLINRREFIGSAAAIAATASGALAEEADEKDDLALEFVWSDDEFGRYLTVVAVVGTRKEALSEPEGAEARSLRRETRQDRVERREAVWRLRPETFGPDTVVTYKPVDGHNHELRLSNVGYGRVRDRELTFKFYRLTRKKQRAQPFFFYGIALQDGVWSTAASTTVTHKFTLEDETPNGKPGSARASLDLRQFGSGERALARDTTARSVTNTYKLMFNGLLGLGPGQSRRKVWVRFDRDGKWTVEPVNDSSTEPFTVFGGRDAITSLEAYWQPPQSGGEGDADGETPLLGICRPEENAPERTYRIGGRNGPGLSVSRLPGPEGEDRTVKLRMQRLRGKEDQPTGRVRAEAVLSGAFTNLNLSGTGTGSATGPFPRLYGAILERVEAPVSLNGTNYSDRAGTISFQGSYGYRDNGDSENAFAPISMETVVGKIVATAVTPEKQKVLAERHPDFPERVGWPVKALFSWARNGAGTRSAPVTRWIDARVAMLESGVELREADFSRLFFEPSELRFFYENDGLASPPLGSYIDLSAPAAGEMARFDLSRATLRASRSHDLVSLAFRFSDLALSFSREKAVVIKLNALCDLSTRPDATGHLTPHDTRPVVVVEYPGQHLFEEARFLPNPPPMADVKIPVGFEIKRMDGSVRRQFLYEADAILSDYDGMEDGIKDQPDFAVTEDGITLDANNRVHVVEALALLDEDGRVALRDALYKLKCWVPNPPPEDQAFALRKRRELKDFVEGPGRNSTAKKALEKLGKTSKLPKDQHIYIGPFALDADAMQAVRLVHEANFDDILKGLAADMFTAVARHSSATPPDNMQAALRQERRLESAIPTYQLFRTFYREVMIASYFDPNSINVRAAKSLEPAEIEFFEASRGAGPVWVEAGRRDILKRRSEAVEALFPSELRGRDDGVGPLRGRLAKPSRLAFRINCPDGIDEAEIRFREDLDLDEDAGARFPRKVLEFSLGELTNFKDYELAVTARAETVYDGGRLGLIDTRHPRVPDRRPGAMLDHLGFTSGPGVTAARRLAEVAVSLVPPTPLETAIEIPSRLTLSPHQDAIVLTPGQVEASVYDDHVPGIAVPEKQGASRLWVTSFLTSKNDVGMDPGLRAVHSPDLRPEALLQRVSLSNDQRSPGNGAPVRGPVAPWLMSRLETQRPLMNGEDAIKRADALLKYDTTTTCEGLLSDPIVRKRYPKIVADLCRIFKLNAPGSGMPTGFRSGLDAYMRHELVLLSSAWGLPVVGATNENGDYQERASQFEPDERHKLTDVMPGTAMYRPRAMDVSELGLSSLGGILRHDTGFEPPAGALFWLDNKSLFDALAIERWQQWTNLGRDIHTEIVFKGYLFPLGIRASLVQVTERTFLIEQGTGAITATLRQRMFIRVANPERSYPGIKHPHAGRRFPVDRLRVLTTTTPDIVDPQSPARAAVSETRVAANGRIDTASATGLAFWPRFVQAAEGNIRFELEIDGVKTDLPLIFVDNTAVNDQDTLRELIDYYNRDTDMPGVSGAGIPSPDNDVEQLTEGQERLRELKQLNPVRHLRTINFRGENRRYAPELEAGSATFQTYHWTLRATGGPDGYGDVTREVDGPSMAAEINLREKLSVLNHDFVFGPIRTGADQPPFYPAIETARIRLTQAERLAARPLGPVRVHFDARYVLHGLEPSESAVAEPLDTLNPNEIFLAVRDQRRLDMGQKGDQSGGVYRPSGHVVALSRKKGLMTLTENVDMQLPRHDNDILYGMSSLFAFDEEAYKTLGVSAGEVASVSQASDQKTQELIDKVRAIYRNFFSGDAKILGIVKMRDLIELIKDQALSSPGEGLPALSEAQEFGANVAEGATDIANTVREEVISPLAAGAREVRSGWDRIEETIRVAQSQVGVGSSIQIRDVFPELDKALTNLSQALTRAEATTDPIEFGFELSVCYTAGQRFLTEIQRAAANPGERIEAAFSAQFGQLLGLFQGALSGRIDVLAALLDELKLEFELENSLEKARKALIEDYLLAELPELIAGTGLHRRREMIALPRGSYWYASDGTFDPDKDDTLLECLDLLLPSEELVKKTVEAFVAFTATEVLSTGQVPNLDALVGQFLSYEPVEPPQECPLTPDNLSGYLSCIRDKHVQLDVAYKTGAAEALTQDLKDRLDEIKAASSGWGLGGALEADVERIIDDVSSALDEISVGDAGSEVLNQGTVGERIRNHYIVCLIIAFPDGSDKVGSLQPIELRQFRIDLLKFLPRLVASPTDFWSDFLPDLSRLFDPLGRLLGAIGEVQASLIPDIDVGRFLSAVRGFLKQIGSPISLPTTNINLESFKAYFCPTWEVARTFMSELSAVAEGGALCLESSTLPSCPLSYEIYDNLADGTIALPAEDVSLCTEALRFATSAHELRGVLDQEAKPKLIDLRNELRDLPPATPKHQEALRRINAALRDMDEASRCLGLIRARSEAVYCDIQADTARLNTLARDLKAASSIDFCAMDDFEDVQEAFDQIKALANLPRDFEAFLDARERVLKRINSFFVEIVQMLQDDSGCWRGIPIVVGLKPFIEDLGLGTVAEDNMITVDAGLSDVADEVKGYFEEIRDAGAQITEMLTQYAKTVCSYAAVLDDLQVHLDRFQDLLSTLQQSGNYSEQIADFLSKNVDTERLLRQISAIGDDVVRIIELRDKYCPPTDPPEFPTIDALADIKIGNESGLDYIGAPDSALSRVADGVRGVAQTLSPVASVLRPIAEKGPRDGVMVVLDPYALQLLEAADDTLADLYQRLKNGRDALGEQLGGIPFLDEVKGKIFISPNAARPGNDQSRPVYVPFKSTGNDDHAGPKDDQLAGDVAWLSTVAQDTPINEAPGPHGPLTDPQRFVFLSAFVTEWVNGEATPVRILLNLQDVIEDVLKGEFFRAIDFNRLREEFEDYLLSLVPTSIRMGYDFDIELGSEVASATRGIFTPGPGTALNVAMNINVALNLDDGSASIDYASVGTLGPFDIKLVGDMFDALTLKFASARFESKSEQKPRFDIEYLDYEIGPELDFLEDLQSFLSPKEGSGAFVRFDPSQPGVEAGYRLQLGDFSVGALAFSNVGLETSAVLPFSDQEAVFRASLSSRASPFTLTYAPYGGSGFFAILATPGSGIIGFEALFEFGGSAVFAFGPLSGKGRLMSGVYVRQFKMGQMKVTEISMTFFAGGSASIWIFHFAASLLVNLGMVDGNMSGQATFSFSFSMGLADFEYSVDIWKQEEKGFNGQSQANIMGPEGLRRFAFLQREDSRSQRTLKDARIKVDAVCQSEDCATYNTYFTDITLPEDYI